MVTLQLENIHVGMFVANDVRNSEGNILLRQGQEIKENHLRLFKIWGICHLEILTEEAEFLQNSPEYAQEQVKNLFIHNDTNHPAIQALFTARLKIEQAAGYPKWEENYFEETDPPSASNIEYKIALLPEIPSVLNELNNVLNDHKSSSHDIAEVIKSSPSLSTKLLRLANSPFYGFCNKIDTISRAVTAIGIREIGEIAVAVCVFEHFKKISNKKINVISFFEHCILCGIIARILAINKEIKKTERFFVYGLIHKIGRLILFSHNHELANYLLYKANNEKLVLNELERELNIHHARAGAELAKKWNFPPRLVDILLNYQKPMNAKYILDAAILHLADIITHSTGIGNSGEPRVPRLSSKAWSELNIDPSLLSVTIKQAQHQAVPLFKLFFSESPEETE